MQKSFILILLILLITSCKRDYSDIISESTVLPSYECGDKPARNLIDKDSTTIWNACGNGTQWLNFNFAKSVEIKNIEIEVNSSVASNIKYDILIRRKDELDYKNIESSNFNISEKYFLKSNFKEQEDISDLKFVIKNDSSWICVSQMKIIGR
jgi:hypothetical protein